MKINLNFLLTDGINIILVNETNMPPCIACDKNIADTIKDFLFTQFSITENLLQWVKFISYVEHDDTLELFHGILLPETFSLPANYYWENIKTLSNVITDQSLLLLILSFLNAI